MSAQSTVKPLRQTFNVVVGWLGVILGLVMLLTGWWGGAGGVLSASGILLGALSFCVMARPSITFANDHVVISNVLRETTLPWAGISHASSRGSLTIHDVAGARTTVWAIGSQKPRSEGGLDASVGVNPGQWRPDPSSLVASKQSARALCEGINAETIDNPGAEASGAVVRWLPLPCGILVAAVLAAVAVCVAHL